MRADAPLARLTVSGVPWDGRENPWQLPAPPAWWLRRLTSHDPALVVLPGLNEPLYRLARRSPRAAHLTPLAHDTETARCVRLRVLPVTSFVPWVVWNEDQFQWLRDHDQWQYGDGATAADRLDALDRERTTIIDRHGADQVDQRSASAWEAMQRRLGTLVPAPGPPVASGPDQRAAAG